MNISRAPATCPICQSAYDARCTTAPSTGDFAEFDCSVCGRFKISGTALATTLRNEANPLTRIQRAALSHFLRRATDEGSDLPVLTEDWLKDSIANTRLPSPAEQAENIIQLVGEHISATGERLGGFPDDFYAKVGAPSPALAGELAVELMQRGLLDGIDASTMGGADLINVNLTLAGWQQYEAQKRGKAAGNYGFLALQFENSTLDGFVRDVIKPCVKETLGFDVVDMRDVSQAGVIDNIMREQIRDAAFVLAELTHDNFGAYWEAGYAEGLGKPVIYLCEKTKFDDKRTHFDTNHCTTVLWAADNPDAFKGELIATIRRSLNLFPTS